VTRRDLGWCVAGVIAVAFIVTLLVRPRIGDTLDDAPAPRRETAAPSVPPAAPVPSPPAVRGRVTDASDGSPVALARVVVSTDAAEGAWLNSDTNEAGEFDVPVARGTFAAGASLRVRVRAPGHRDWRGTATIDAPLDVRLEAVAGGPVPGRVAGTAVDSEGSPIAGEIAVQGRDDFLGTMHRAALADATGRFLLEGVTPGRWSLVLADGGIAADVLVPEDGTVVVTLRTRDRQLPAPPFADAAGIDAEIRDLDARAARLRKDAASLGATSSVREELERQLAGVAQTRAALVREQVRAAPHRAVLVRGLPRDVRTWVAAPGDEGDWVVEARAGEAFLPPLALGAARVEVRRHGAPPESFVLRVEAGAGAQVVEVPRR
jgi:hypothetical protein